MIDVCYHGEDLFALTHEGVVHRLGFLTPAGAVSELLQQQLAPLATQVRSSASEAVEPHQDADPCVGNSDVDAPHPLPRRPF